MSAEKPEREPESGVLQAIQPSTGTVFFTTKHPMCPTCLGTGFILVDGEFTDAVCAQCKGRGFLP